LLKTRDEKTVFTTWPVKPGLERVIEKLAATAVFSRFI